MKIHYLTRYLFWMLVSEVHGKSIQIMNQNMATTILMIGYHCNLICRLKNHIDQLSLIAGHFSGLLKQY